MYTKNLILTAASSALILSSCSSTTSGTAYKSAVDKAMGDCVASVAGGAILGALIGAAVGGDMGDGALIGGAAGVGVCGFLMNRASAEDKAKMAEMELAALNSSTYGMQRQSFVSTNGTDVFSVITNTQKVEEIDYPEVVVESYNIAENDATTTPAVIYDKEVGCKKYKTQIIVDGKTVNQEGVSCRTVTGDWVNF
ncbi:hypothetical protein OAP52_05090 [Hellea sp.]|nr:hypothetical protein [Hellea sp.]